MNDEEYERIYPASFVDGVRMFPYRLADDGSREYLAPLSRPETEQLRLKVGMLEGTLLAAVVRLGGWVEGRPTERVNFLQRIDELRAIETAAARGRPYEQKGGSTELPDRINRVLSRLKREAFAECTLSEEVEDVLRTALVELDRRPADSTEAGA
jgi:hypothetical protein